MHGGVHPREVRAPHHMGLGPTSHGPRECVVCANSSCLALASLVVVVVVVVVISCGGGVQHTVPHITHH